MLGLHEPDTQMQSVDYDDGMLEKLKEIVHSPNM